MRYLINFSYDGSNYCGYQIQPNLDTIQERLEKAIEVVNKGIRKSVHSSGRTDKGVHALDQWAHVDLDIDITPYKLKRALNSNLPDDIHVIMTYQVEDSFHARYSVKNKEYKYLINLGEYIPMERNYVFQYNYKLDISSMRDAVKIFLGEHDFRAFVTDSKNKSNCVRNIYYADISEYQKNKYVITFKGNGFLRYQIRNMVGILIKVGEGKITSFDVKNILESKDRNKTGVTAPSNGLYLTKVSYDMENVIKNT